MPHFLARVPSSRAGQHVALHVHEISFTSNTQRGLARAWHDNVQPIIQKDVARPDFDWNWPFKIAPLILFGLAHRGGRLFQVTAGAEGRPAAMIAVLSRERWCLDPREPATFVFYLSAAPSEWLDSKDALGVRTGPKLIGQAALDVAVCIALDECDGRLWLHAAPKGGQTLLSWYLQRGMQVVDAVKYPTLPGFATGRPNDGRYLYMDGTAATQAYNALAHLR